jgi:hypothetical protein
LISFLGVPYKPSDKDNTSSGSRGVGMGGVWVIVAAGSFGLLLLVVVVVVVCLLYVKTKKRLQKDLEMFESARYARYVEVVK